VWGDGAAGGKLVLKRGKQEVNVQHENVRWKNVPEKTVSMEGEKKTATSIQLFCVRGERGRGKQSKEVLMKKKGGGQQEGEKDAVAVQRHLLENIG